jgi:hypothetical protein
LTVPVGVLFHFAIKDRGHSPTRSRSPGPYLVYGLPRHRGDPDGVVKTRPITSGTVRSAGALLDMRGLPMLAHIHQHEMEIIEGGGKPAREGSAH